MLCYKLYLQKDDGKIHVLGFLEILNLVCAEVTSKMLMALTNDVIPSATSNMAVVNANLDTLVAPTLNRTSMLDLQ